MKRTKCQPQVFKWPPWTVWRDSGRLGENGRVLDRSSTQPDRPPNPVCAHDHSRRQERCVNETQLLDHPTVDALRRHVAGLINEPEPLPFANQGAEIL